MHSINLYMKKIVFLLSLLVFSCISVVAKQNNEYLHHRLNIEFDISNSKISVVDTMYFPQETTFIKFYLNSNLTIISSNIDVSALNEITSNGNKSYELSISDEMSYLILHYEGEISNNKELFIENEKGKRVGTSGLIFDKGIYLSGSTYWVPSVENNDLFTFDLTVNIPAVWKIVSQGKQIYDVENGNKKIVKYSSQHPGNQVYLVANKWTEYTRTIAGKDIRVFLVNPDEALAQRYLGVTTKYMMMYQKMIGDYPYSKFDVVENFWETGFGMPSFTLLGQQVIRFPWILASSYPHEYLHNYWGNSVFVDYKSGNWCEGLTTYMADYLLKEQKGEGLTYRRNMLKKYTDYVTEENDYPVSKFTSKTDEVSEAIGYAKVFMINHMLRKKYGAQKFIKAYANFYEKNKFEKASFLDIQQSFEEITNDELSGYFAQWVNKVGAPTILLKDVSIDRTHDDPRLIIEIEQIDVTNAFTMEVPVLIYFDKSKKIIRETIHLNDWTARADFSFTEEPIRIDIDPAFDVMRKLAKEEVPTTFSGILGSKEWIILLPKSSPFYNEYKAFAKNMQQMYARRGKIIDIVDDDSISELPSDKSVWVLGLENIFSQQISYTDIYKDVLGSELMNQLTDVNTNGVLVYAISNPANIEKGILYFNSSKADNIIKMTRKLMHYGSYSYLGFDSETLKNTLSGTFPIKNSPLSKVIGSKKNIDWSKFSLPETDVLFK